MDTLTYTRIGSIHRVQGTKGQLCMRIEAGLSPISGIETVFLAIDHTMVPYSVQQMTWQLPYATLMLKGVADREVAYGLKGHSVFVPSAIVTQQYTDTPPPPTLLIGYHINDEHTGILGTVQDVYTAPQQTLLVIPYKEQELLIPYEEAFVGQIDHAKKTIQVTLPPGFLSIYGD